MQQQLTSDEDQVKNPTIEQQWKLEDEGYKYQKLWKTRHESYALLSFHYFCKNIFVYCCKV